MIYVRLDAIALTDRKSLSGANLGSHSHRGFLQNIRGVPDEFITPIRHFVYR